MGIVTETDVLLAGASSRRPFHEIPVADVVSHPPITTTGEATIRRATERMTATGIKKLPVVDGLELAGILTVTDVATHYTDLTEEARMVAAQREGWDARTDVGEF
jgi:CBS domain-containing protein